MRTSLILALIVAGSAGCATCFHGAGDLALEETRCPEVPASLRSKTYAILVKGFDPLDIAGVESLRESLTQAGFPKIYRIECHHAGYIEREVARIRCDHPDARFVLIGCGTGAMMARGLARSIDGVDAVVEIAPAYPAILAQGYSVAAHVRHIVIGRVGMGSYSPGARTEYRIVPGLGRLTPCTHPLVIDMVREQLVISAQSIDEIEESPGLTLPLVDHPAPLPGELPAVSNRENTLTGSFR